MSKSDVSIGRIRLHALALATATALCATGAVAAERLNLDGLRSAELHDRFIVKYREGSATRTDDASLEKALARAARALPADASRRAPGIQRLRRTATGAEVIRTDRKLDRAEAESLMRQLAANPDVEYVEVDKLNRLFLTPNDTYFSQQYGFGTGAGGIRATEAWDRATGAGVVVAVLDTGITSHSDLNANILPGYDFISDSFVANDGNGRDPDPSDPGDWVSANQCGFPHSAQSSSWHGTHVAGTVAAVTNNGKGVAGTAFNAKVVPVRVLGRCGGYDSDIADAIIWASGGTVGGVPANANPAEVINLSLGGQGSCGTTMQNAINSAVSRGTTVVIAAGNDNANVSGYSPANCNNVIAVASVTNTGARSSFSNYGSLIDIAAPGSSIVSTLNSGSTSPGSETYASYSGTSMATPHVAGVVALVQSVAPTPLTPAQVETLLKNTARPFPATPSQPIGAGIVDAKAAVDAVLGGNNGGGGNVLQKGVPVTGLSGASGSTQYWTVNVPAGASNLVIKTSGGTGDVDLYVRHGSQPTTGTYDCRPYLSGNNETCTFASPQAGTWHVMLRGYTSYSGVSLLADWTAGGGGNTPQTYTNDTDYPIYDNATVESPITVSGRTGNAPSNTPVAVDIRHTWRGDLKVDLVAPDGSVYVLHNRTGGSADNVIGTYTVNLSSEPKNGTWKLRVTDYASGDTGYINSWSITF